MTKLTKKQESLLNELLADFNGDAEDLLGKNGLLMRFKKLLLNGLRINLKSLPTNNRT